MYRVIVQELEPRTSFKDGDDPFDTIERYSQSVDTVDLKKVIEAVNYKPRVRTKKGANGDAKP